MFLLGVVHLLVRKTSSWFLFQLIPFSTWKKEKKQHKDWGNLNHIGSWSAKFPPLIYRREVDWGGIKLSRFGQNEIRWWPPLYFGFMWTIRKQRWLNLKFKGTHRPKAPLQLGLEIMVILNLGTSIWMYPKPCTWTGSRPPLQPLCHGLLIQVHKIR